MDLSERDELITGFTAAMFFSSFDEIADEDENEISEETELYIESVCSLFFLKCGHMFAKIPDLSNQDLTHIESIGADLLYTIQGAGVGFWEDDKYPKTEKDGTGLGVYFEYVVKSLPGFEPYIENNIVYS